MHFDRIFCINVIYFWDDPAAHLREVRRVLKPGGTFTAVFRTRAAMVKMPFTQFGFAMYEQAGLAGGIARQWIRRYQHRRATRRSDRIRRQDLFTGKFGDDGCCIVITVPCTTSVHADMVMRGSKVIPQEHVRAAGLNVVWV
jgi:SAM-dependent methyltransferase